LVSRRCPPAHEPQLSRWIHTVNPINRFVQQSRPDDSCELIYARKAEYPKFSGGLFKHVYSYFWSVSGDEVMGVMNISTLFSADIL
ncbi:hypothetical protein, partial [Parasedimentitalea denitrificans]|uniref:hypothetical protein n=1 Tax=Parasedimentitalea denitrificans TaxID=2211118 RepID=UPI00197FE89E